ncbi:VanZ family protein [Ruthenibacterium lactatiformans]|uniref:VanZ family protein n=1 Tax=Ruthenibacterium lactatiformans TaxID=1550024 RepID=UPI001FA9A3F7|nr:VanZ family protein [Ruthenibacterium lactatiformans]
MMQQNHTNGRLTDRERTPARLIVLRVLFTLFAAGTVVVIFSNSMQSGAASGLRSAAVTQWLNGGLARMGGGWRFSERLVRKLGHFSEYALLGFWLMLSLRVYTRRILSHISWPLFFGLLAGVLDEGIQMFADGRGSDVRDVVIDFSGVVFGLLAALFLLLLVRMFHVLRESKTPL